jgi:hypothetical protein
MKLFTLSEGLVALEQQLLQPTLLFMKNGKE